MADVMSHHGYTHLQLTRLGTTNNQPPAGWTGLVWHFDLLKTKHVMTHIWSMLIYVYLFALFSFDSFQTSQAIHPHRLSAMYNNTLWLAARAEKQSLSYPTMRSGTRLLSSSWLHPSGGNGFVYACLRHVCLTSLSPSLSLSGFPFLSVCFGVDFCLLRPRSMLGLFRFSILIQATWVFTCQHLFNSKPSVQDRKSVV